LVRLLTAIASLAALAAAAGRLPAAELSDRHELKIELDWNLIESHSSLGAWPDGGFGKLRYDTRGSGSRATRLAVDYTGQVLPTLFGHVVMEVIENASTPAGVTEAYLEWRPLPSGPSRNRFRFGAFYPAFSVENSATAWASPYSRSFSSVNSWLGEEIRPFGVDWKLTRPIGAPRSPHELGAFAGLFYGNDPAGTLLFWRGWSIHDRQTRLNERLPLPPLVLPSQSGGPDVIIERKLDPFVEIDGRPGFYAGSEWRYAARARLSLAFYDNRADAYAYRNGQWAWGTRFWHFAAQVALPGDVGLIAQRLRGDTDWLTPTPRDGVVTPETEFVVDEFDAYFVLLSKAIDSRHRISLRFDAFDAWRPGQLQIDRGDALTAAYHFQVNSRLALQLEWMQIESSRDLWPVVYGQAKSRHTEDLLQLGFRLAIFDSTRNFQ
jgi:hypothetical protein